MTGLNKLLNHSMVLQKPIENKENLELGKKLSNQIDSIISVHNEIKLFLKYNYDLLSHDLKNIKTQSINQQKKSKLWNQIWKFLDKFPPISPYNKIVIIWDIIQIIALFVLLFSYPLIYSIEAKFNSKIEKVFSTIVLSDILMRLNIGFYEMDTLVVCKRKIFSRYIQQGFVYDFIGNISIISYFIEVDHANPWILLIFSKTQVIRKLLINVEEIFFHNFQIRNWLKLLKLIFTIAFFSHLFACGWILIGRQSLPMTWIIKANLAKQDWLINYFFDYYSSLLFINCQNFYLTLSKSYIYVKSLYFSLVTMITVGYGDVTPTNFGETIFVSCVMMLACGLFGYSLNQIGQIFDGAFRSSDRLRENIAIMSVYMKKKKISTPLQFKIRQYLQQQIYLIVIILNHLIFVTFNNRFYWNENKSEEQDKEQEIKSILSQQLQDELILDANKLVLREARILVDNFSEAVMKKTASLIRQLHCTPEELIFQEGDCSDKNLYFIEKGQCEIFLDGNDKQLAVQELQSGQYFGSWSFFTGFPRSCSVRSKGFCTLLYVCRDEFLEICKQNNEEFEKFCMIKDKMIFDSDYQTIESRCFSCQKYSHQFYDCPILHYNQRQNYLNQLKKEAGAEHTFRIKKPKKYKKQKALSQISKVIKCQQLFSDQNKFEIQNYEQDNFLTLIANMYSNDLDIYDSFLNNDDSPQVIEDTPQKNGNQLGSQSSKRWSSNGGLAAAADSLQSFSRANSQHLQQNNTSNLQENIKSTYNTANSQQDEQISVKKINSNVQPAVDQNYFFSQQYLSQHTDQTKNQNTVTTPQKYPNNEDSYVVQMVPIIPLNGIDAENQIIQKSGIISTLLAVNSNLNTSGHHPIRSLNIKSSTSNISPRESLRQYDKQRSNQTLKNSVVLRSRNNSAFSNCSNLSSLNKKSHLIFNKISNQFMDLDNDQEKQNINPFQEYMTIQEEINEENKLAKLLTHVESIKTSVQLEQLYQQQPLFKNQSSQLSQSIQKLYPFSKELSVIKRDNSTFKRDNSAFKSEKSTNSKSTNMLSALLKFKKVISKKAKSRFQAAENILQQQLPLQKNISRVFNPQFSSKLQSGSPKESKNSQGMNFDLNYYSSDIFFFLMQNRNIYQYSESQQILDEGFERMASYKNYYPFGNSEIIIRTFSLSLEDKNKHIRRILEIQKKENRRTRKSQNNISRLKEKFQQELITVDNTPKKAQDEIKTFRNNDNNCYENDSFSSIFTKQKYPSPNLKQQLTNFVSSNQILLHSKEPSAGVVIPNTENREQNNQIFLIENQHFSDSIIEGPISQEIINFPQQQMNSQIAPSMKQTKSSIKSKYYVTKQQEQDEQIQEMDKDLSVVNVVDVDNSINKSICNISINNLFIQNYLDEQ